MKLVEYLESFLTVERKEKFNSLSSYRMRHLTVALENIFQSQNASAVLRTSDCFGVQDVHIIENSNEYNINPQVTLGSSKWLSLHRYNQQENNTLECIQSLKEKGYRIVATTPHKNDCLIDELPIDQKLCLFFGTELTGLSDIVMDHADEFVKIPLYGFSESFNISVSAAISIFNITERIRKSSTKWQLSEQEIDQIRLDWCRASLKRTELLEKDYYKLYKAKD